ncbi:MAG: type II toxin-antitoxin system mRNA interferase toxin, RelE/StbE family [Deltaproteobacteria bacterium]|nr:type II toxin-antitoxin system mRNA interferase toxin, RelE/StbE family [Deltaproteobacteria bacterium]
MNVVWDEGFKRSYRKKVKNNEKLKEKFWRALDVFIEAPFTSQLKTHKLSGRLEGLWAFSISNDQRVIFKFLDKDKVLFIDIGSHDEVY